MTREAFTRAVEERAKRSSFTRALYDTLDEYQTAEREATATVVACSRGCSWCCHQMVCVFPGEMREITNHINKLAGPIRRSLRERARPILKKWVEWFKQRLSVAEEQLRNPILLAQAWVGKPCPMLQEDGSCGIYAARPLVCRTTTSDLRCDQIPYKDKGVHAQQMRLECEIWTNNLLMDHEYANGAVGATPMHHFFNQRPHKL